MVYETSRCSKEIFEVGHDWRWLDEWVRRTYICQHIAPFFDLFVFGIIVICAQGLHTAFDSQYSCNLIILFFFWLRFLFGRNRMKRCRGTRNLATLKVTKLCRGSVRHRFKLFAHIRRSLLPFGTMKSENGWPMKMKVYEKKNEVKRYFSLTCSRQCYYFETSFSGFWENTY